VHLENLLGSLVRFTDELFERDVVQGSIATAPVEGEGCLALYRDGPISRSGEPQYCL
jgi:hypothetical protein